MTPRSASSTPGESGDRALAVMETELAMLARTLEGLSRRSSIHRGLDRSSYLLLRTLETVGSASINGLAQLVGLDATTITRQVATMEASGLVLRRRSPADARVSVLELSALGRRRMEGVRVAREERIGDLVGNWSDRDRRSFGALLRRFNEAIQANPPPE
jgi:DNA-binding MarR family transcriptional regulator